MSASVGTLRKLARFYKTNILNFLMGQIPAAGACVPMPERFWRLGWVRMELLAWGNTVMEPHIFRVAPAAESGDSYTHEGEEFLYILRGEFAITLNSEEYRLKPGDSFTSRVRFHIAGKNPAEPKHGCCG